MLQMLTITQKCTHRQGRVYVKKRTGLLNGTQEAAQGPRVEAEAVGTASPHESACCRCSVFREEAGGSGSDGDRQGGVSLWSLTKPPGK